MMKAIKDRQFYRTPVFFSKAAREVGYGKKRREKKGSDIRDRESGADPCCRCLYPA